MAILIGVVLSMGFKLPPTVSGLIAFGLAVLLACFLAFRDQYRKARNLQRKIDSRILVSCGRTTPKSVIRSLNGDMFFRCRMDLKGITPVRHVKAAITTIRANGDLIDLAEEALLMLHPGHSYLSELAEGVAEFIDVIKIPKGSKPVLALIGHYGAVNPGIFAHNINYELDVSITAHNTRTKFCTFAFLWAGVSDTAEFSMREREYPEDVTQPLSIPNKATSLHSRVWSACLEIYTRSFDY